MRTPSAFSPIVRIERWQASLWLTVLMLGSAGCLQASNHPSPAPQKLPFEGVTDRLRLSTQESDSSFLSLLMRVEQKTEYDVSFRANASWENSKAYFVYNAIIEKSDAHSVLRAFVYWEADTSCDKNSGLQSLDSCPEKTLVSNTNNTMGGTLYPGTYALYSTAFGASNAVITIEAQFNQSVHVLQLGEGRTTLDILDDQRIDGGPLVWPEINTSKQVHPEGLFYAIFHTAGRRLAEPNYTTEGPQGEHKSFRKGGFDYENETGARVREPGFAGMAGTWNLSTSGGLRSPEAPAAVLIGMLERPPFVSWDGTLLTFGGTD